jgi:inorganic pyrophosphatase
MVIDRPLGSRHPRDPDLVYEVNYGYVPGTLAPDGHPIDAYVLGADGALDAVDGTVVAVIRRRDDVEDKLVVAVSGTWSSDAIRDATHFQEQWFDSFVEMA